MSTQKAERLDKLLSRLGYGSRKEIAAWVKNGWVTVDGKPARSPSDKALADQVQFDDEPMDHPDGLTLIYHKALGSVCSHKEDGPLIYDDLPERWNARNPALSSVGRLDKETSGLLIITDDGQLNHWLTSPKQHIPKTYHAVLDRPLNGNEADVFASGTLMLDSEDTPLLPAEMQILNEKEALLTLHEGRYHQVRRMFAAVGNHVNELTRVGIGELKLAEIKLAPGEYQSIPAENLRQQVCPEQA